MAFLQVSYFSQVLDVTASVNVLLPEKAADPAHPPKVLYLLHGYSNDHTAWMRKSSIERYAEPFNLAVIMPAVNHSFYCNEAYGERYWDFVSDELPRTMQRMFRLSDRPEDTFVAGLSMGGYGAMRLALTYPERFRAAGSFSGAVLIDAFAGKAAYDAVAMRLFGENRNRTDTEVDLRWLLRQNAAAPHKPRLYVSCGTEDFLFDMHRAFVPLAEQAGWDVTHREEPGASHAWEFWDAEIRRFLAFIAEA